MIRNVTKRMKYLFALFGLLLPITFLLPRQSQAQDITDKKNEFSTSLERVRGGRSISDSFNGGGVGLSYNRQLVPYVLLHSELSFEQFFLMDRLGDSNYQNNMIITDLGAQLVPISYKRFELHFGLAASLKYQQKSDYLDPENLNGQTAGGEGEKPLTDFFNYSSVHLGYKFELKTLFIVSDRWQLGPLATVRSYPKGRYDIPRSFEFGMQGGYRF